MKLLKLLVFSLVMALTLAVAAAAGFPGGENPGQAPTLFAPGLVNTGLLTRDVAMTPDGRELYFCQATAGYGHAVILKTRKVGETWHEPVVADFSGNPDWVDLEPCISPDGRQFFFFSSRPATPGGEPAQDIWVMDRAGDLWSEPRNLGFPINTEAPEYFPSVTAAGTLYFCRADPQTRVHSLYRSILVEGQYQEPELLPEQANAGRNRFNAWVAPDESRMIIPVAGHPENHGGVDYWLSLRDVRDNWSGPFNLGALVNDGSPGSWSPYVSPDGQTFFFMSGRTSGAPTPWPESWAGLQARHIRPGSGRAGIFWMEAAFLDEVAVGRPPALPAAEEKVATAVLRAPVPWPGPRGAYLGQDPPGLEPKIFAPGLISTGLFERDIHISADGSTIYFGVMDLGLVTVLMTRNIEGRWTEPVTAGFHPDQGSACFEPTFSPDGKTVLFLSNQAAPGQHPGQGWANQNIFTSRFAGGRWSLPRALPSAVTSPAAEYFPSLAADGTLYFSREDQEGNPFLWQADPADEGYAEPQRLPAAVNIGTSSYNAFVAPDESFLITCVAGHEDNLGPADYWISLRDAQDKWRPAQNMGEIFNGPDRRASSAFLSPDGDFLFFSSSRGFPGEGERLTRADLHRIHASPGNGASDIWWVSARVLDAFRL